MTIPSDGYAEGGEAYTDEEMALIYAEELMETMFSVKVELISTIHLNPGQIVEIEGDEYQIVWDGLEDKWTLRPSS